MHEHQIVNHSSSSDSPGQYFLPLRNAIALIQFFTTASYFSITLRFWLSDSAWALYYSFNSFSRWFQVVRFSMVSYWRMALSSSPCSLESQLFSSFRYCYWVQREAFLVSQSSAADCSFIASMSFRSILFTLLYSLHFSQYLRACPTVSQCIYCSCLHYQFTFQSSPPNAYFTLCTNLISDRREAASYWHFFPASFSLLSRAANLQHSSSTSLFFFLSCYNSVSWLIPTNFVIDYDCWRVPILCRSSSTSSRRSSRYPCSLWFSSMSLRCLVQSWVVCNLREWRSPYTSLSWAWRSLMTLSWDSIKSCWRAERCPDIDKKQLIKWRQSNQCLMDAGGIILWQSAISFTQDVFLRPTSYTLMFRMRSFPAADSLASFQGSASCATYFFIFSALIFSKSSSLHFILLSCSRSSHAFFMNRQLISKKYSWGRAINYASFFWVQRRSFKSYAVIQLGWIILHLPFYLRRKASQRGTATGEPAVMGPTEPVHR